MWPEKPLSDQLKDEKFERERPLGYAFLALQELLIKKNTPKALKKA